MIRHYIKTVTLFVLINLCLLIASQTQAYDVPLQWDKNGDASHYKVYWGTESGDYPNVSENVAALTYTIPDLSDGITYFISVKAYNECGNSSDFAVEVKTKRIFSPTILQSCFIETTQTGGN